MLSNLSARGERGRCDVRAPLTCFHKKLDLEAPARYTDTARPGAVGKKGTEGRALESNDSLMECNWEHSDGAGTRPERGTRGNEQGERGALQSIVMIIVGLPLKRGGGGN